MNSQRKILSLRALQKKIASFRRSGGGAKTVVFTNGCFDLLHAGHVQYLERAKRMGDVLIIGLNSDASIRRLKGSARPIVPQRARAAVVAALGCVDYVTIFTADTPQRLIAALAPDILVKGADWKTADISGADTVRRAGGCVRRVRLREGFSTTQLIRKIVDTCRV
ncbi:MAG: D-glycero-beta-D-manno-heptose 1-phosphate adenylyltransferase [Candidatus Omnitrophica bacterium]|nr:D-glycero-beta-D-manno-heptose 1-phosphate adenylyltransferase [Candidatus Omnitrophota bacterium]